MSPSTDSLERTLRRDLEALAERLADEGFCSDLYRALTNNAWRKRDGPEGHLSLSWSRAERLVNELRDVHGEPELTLAQTGGEGEVSRIVAHELGRLGWSSRPLDTGRHDAQHVGEPHAAPPSDQGERQAPVEDSSAWERRAHREADERSAAVPPPARGGTGPAGRGPRASGP